MGGSVPANVPQDSSRAQSTRFYIGFIHMERLLRKREVDTEEGQLWFLQGSLWSCGTRSAQPSGTSAPTLVLLDPVWNGFKDQEDDSAGDVLTAETQGLISEPQQSRGEKNLSMVGLICCSSSGRQRQEAPGVQAQKWPLPQTNFRTCFY